MKHPLDIINEHFTNGYYKNLPPFTDSKDAAATCYLLGYCSKTVYNVVKAMYEQVNLNKKYTKQLLKNGTKVICIY